jgi:hypothetical protein
MIQATNNSLSYANKSIIEAQEREMAEYLKPVNRSIILLFGTCTGDHYVGMENMKREPHERNFIFCITADYHEHLKFIRLLQKNPETGKYYRLLYGDVDRIPLHLFPKVDIAALLYTKENSDHLDSDTNLIRKMLESISPNTEILLPARPRSSEQSYFSFVTDFAKANDSHRNLHLVEKVTTVSSLISLERVINSCSAVVNRAYNDPHVGHIYQNYCKNYDDCTGWYSKTPIIIKAKSSDVQNLLIVSHPDDEVIFGTSLLESPEVWMVIYLTNDFQRIEMAKKLTESWHLGGMSLVKEGIVRVYVSNSINIQIWYRECAGAIMFNHGDSYIESVKMHFSLFLELRKLIGSQTWNILETHSVTGEYGHPFHIIVHKVIMHILKTMNSNTRPRSVKVFSLDGNEGGTLVNKKVQALEEIYQIPNNTFWEQIKGSESVEFSYENLSDKMYDSVANHLCI